MKCPECGGVGRIHYGEEWCSACNGTGEFVTNEEWLRSCNTEQLAEAIYECVMANSWSFSKDGIKRWLKQPHKP